MNHSNIVFGFPLISLTLLGTAVCQAQTVFVSRMWHNHQPTYWPEWNSNGGENSRVEYAWDSIVLKSGRWYTPAGTTTAPWAKTGFTVLPATAAYLAAESSNSYISWFNTNDAATESRRADGQQMEGSIDLATAFPAMPENLYLTALAYQTADFGILGAQAPAMFTENGNVDPNELLVFPIEALRDEDANGVFDRLETGKGFLVTGASRSGNSFSIAWNSFPGRTYQAQSRPDLAAGPWTNVPGALVTAGPSDLTLSQDLILNPEEPRRFFRVVLLPRCQITPQRNSLS